MIPKTTDQLLEEHSLFRQKVAPSKPGRHPYVPSVGTVGARVAIVGFCPQPKETEPLSGVIGEILTACSAPMQWVFRTYLVRSRPASNRALSAAVRKWTPLLVEELGIVRPTAVILCGSYAARAVLGTSEVDTAKLRSIRYVLKESLPDMNFFVTYSPEEIIASGGVGSLIAQSTSFDFMAVFEGITKYFSTTKTIEA